MVNYSTLRNNTLLIGEDDNKVYVFKKYKDEDGIHDQIGYPSNKSSWWPLSQFPEYGEGFSLYKGNMNPGEVDKDYDFSTTE